MSLIDEINKQIKKRAEDPKNLIECVSCRKKYFYQLIGPEGNCMDCGERAIDDFIKKKKVKVK